MIIENVMYFVLGFVAAALLALMIMPSIWRRATRLTKKRIEAATPMTMSEFRADKDQLRAEFALSTRRLEMNVEALRQRLADQLEEINRKRIDQAKLKSERDEQLTIVRELEARESTLRRRILDLEKEGTDLAQRLRMKDRDYSKKVKELERLRNRDGAIPSNHVDEVLEALEGERQRAERLEEQVHRLIQQLETQGSQTATANLVISELRDTLAGKDDDLGATQNNLVQAEVRMANAESRLSELLQETRSLVETEEGKTGQLLAEKLSLEEELEALREKVISAEAAILSDWDNERLEQSYLRERLNDIASDVSKLVYSVEEDLSDPASESLFDRVQKFSDDVVTQDNADTEADMEENPTSRAKPSSRMRALKDMHVR
ncbi:MAG TPA: hypothetical protein ENK61_00875 [Devosia sp.]|nr:hypothetical protein [Devosia sp.]